MESQLKQRLVGAAVLVALAVIFLPMLVKGPAPDSGVSDVPLQVPDAPRGDFQTRDLPLVVPDEAPAGGAVGMQAAPPPADDEALPTVDTAAARQGVQDADAAAAPEPMLPATTAGGDYAVHFGAYASSVNADTVVSRLRAARLPAFREATRVDGKQAWRVRIGPYATRADAEIARLEAVRAGKQPGARVVALDAAEPATPASAPQPASAGTAEVAAQPLPPATVATKPMEKPAAKPVADAPKPVAKPAAPAASGVGFAVQIGAFGNAAQAAAKRDQLRGAGFSAFTETVRTDKGTLTRVLAGPVVSRAEADQLRAQVRAKLGVDGMVRAHP
ncbi:MAG TPA: SPOR domain-containing protein [Luteimonas sp.]|nr:SPOR domain-containing protein [Luteimonas sp.]